MSEPLIYDYDQAAEKLGKPVSANWLSANKKRLPHCEFGDRIGFTLAQLIEIAELQAVRPGQTASSVEHPTPLPKPAAKSVASLRPRGSKQRSA